MIRTFKRKLNPNKDQAKRLMSWIGACRVVYNLGLEIKIASYKNTGKYISSYDLMRQLPDLKKDCAWIQDVASQTLQATLERLDNSYKKFFKGSGFPKWASKKNFKSFCLKKISVSGNSVIIPKMGRIRIFKDSPVLGTTKTAQIVIEPTGLFICIQCEMPDYKPCSESQATGIDMGISHFCILSDGTMVSNPNHFLKYEKKLRIYNRSLARKKKGSNSWKRQCKLLGRLHHTISNVRRDFLHKTSSTIAKQFGVVYVEDLNIMNMTRNKNLAKHILDCGWGMFRIMLEYKTKVIRVDPKFTSQTCNVCGFKDSKSRISQSEFVCTNCGIISNADINAAKNIMSKGVALVRQRSAIAQA